jgi:fumarate reductase (CoM/CoB) subunit B
MGQERVKLQIYRFDPSRGEGPHYDEFDVPFSKGLTVLDGLIYVYENIDSSLSFRWSCKNVQCGACGMLVNGEAVLACERQMAAGERVKVDPFPLPVIKDVVSDFSTIEDKKVRTFSEPKPAGRPERLSSEEVSPLIPLHKCLDCHICDVVCPLNKGKERIEPGSFLPSDLVQLASIVFNKREGENRAGLAFSKKVYHCLTCGECVNACPVDIDIVNEAIEKLRQNFMKRDRDSYRKLFDPKDWVERWIELKGKSFLEGAKTEYRVSGAKGEVGLFLGCMLNRRQQDLASSMIRALNRAGLDVLLPKNQRCCGYPLMRMGMVDEAENLLRNNISVFEETGVARVITACPDCSFAFQKDYARLFGNGNGNPRFEVLDVLQTLPEPSIKIHSKVACHNPCYLAKKGIRLSDELARRGIQVTEVIETCCGAGGGVYFTNPQVARDMGQKAVCAVQSEIVVTGCPFCKEQFENVIGKERKVLHYLEVLDQS